MDWLGDTEWMVHDLRDVLAALAADPSDHHHYDGLLRVVGVDKDKRRRMAIVCSAMDGREEMVRAIAEMLKGVDRSCRSSDVEDRVMAIVQGAVDAHKVLLDQPPVAMTKEVVREIAAEVDALVKAAPATFDPKERAAEKQRSRDEDARAIASGEATVADIRRKNAAFRVGKVDILGSKR